MKFRVKYKLKSLGVIFEEIEAECGWFLVDQAGTIYSHGPMKPLTPLGDEYISAIPLIKIGKEWLSIEEIEKRIR